MLYFDHNATSPLRAAAREAWLEANSRYIGNASSPHRLGARADHALNQAREKLAAWLGCAPCEIVWTSGATESNNTVIRHFAAEPGEAWISAIEHPCVRESVRQHFPNRHRLIPVDPDGVVSADWIKAQLAESRPAFVAVMAANNETGVLQPWLEVARLCREAGIPFFCDAAQWIGKLPLEDLASCDFLSGCAHKFGGPQGVGFLKCPLSMRPLLLGGPQEEGRRAGTENLAGVLAMIAGLESVKPASKDLEAQFALRLNFEGALKAALPVEIVGANAPRLWNTVSVIMPEIDCRQRWVVKLDKLGFAVSTGSACASGKEKPSEVLSAMGFSASSASRVLRFSSTWETTAADWEQLLGALVQAAG